MKRLLVHVEGESEEVFVNQVLRPHLVAHGVWFRRDCSGTVASVRGAEG